MLSEPTPDKALLTKKLNELYQERKDLISNIKNLTRRHKLIKDNLKQQALVGQRPQSNTNLEEQCHPNPTARPEHHQHLNTKEEDIKEVVAAQNTIRDRNKRLFGGLNVHLKKAEQKLREEEQKAKEKMTIEEQAVKKEREDTTKLQEERLRQLEEQLAKLTGKRERVEEELLETENTILKLKFSAYVSDRGHYLTTRTHPPLPWQPVHFSPQLSSLLAQANQEGKVQQEKVVEQIMNYKEKFDYFSYNIQNEKQYYNNILDSYLTNCASFILTKTQPKLLWTPVAGKLAERVRETAALLKEEGVRKKENNEQYYLRFSKSAEVEQVVDENDSESR